MSARMTLLNAAATLATSEGVTALGVERVVKEAGVSKGTFFYHFSTKAEMIHALLDHVRQSCMAEVDDVVANGGRFTDALIDMVVHELKSNGALISVLIATVSLDPSLRPTLTEQSEQWRNRMIVEDGLSPDSAELLRLAIDGAMVGSVLYEPEGRIARATNAERVLRTIASKTNPLPAKP